MTENKTKITIAIIGLIGILGGAFFANWDKVFQPEPALLPAPSEPIHPVNGENKPKIPPNNEQAEILQRIEELQWDLENNKRESIKANEEIQRLRPFLETDRDAPQAIENQERWLEELEMSRNQVEREIKGLREQLQEN